MEGGKPHHTRPRPTTPGMEFMRKWRWKRAKDVSVARLGRGLRIYREPVVETHRHVSENPLTPYPRQRMLRMS